MTTTRIVRRFDPLGLIDAHPQRYPALLESVAESNQTGSHDLLPIANGRWLALGSDGRVHDQDGRPLGDDFANALDAEFAAAGPSLGGSGDSLFRGGWLLYLGYETAAQFEPSLRLPAFSAATLPVALALRTPAVWLRRRSRASWPSDAEAAADPSDASASNCGGGAWTLVVEPGYEALIEQTTADLMALPVSQPREVLPSVEVSEEPPSRFLDGVARVHAYLRAGDVFQVNLSRAWQARFAAAVDPIVLYRRLRRISPAPFAGLLRFGAAAVISASPERLLRVRGSQIDTRPIAGTRPRGSDALRDAALRNELLGHPKERAEHVMLIDLERNDLGRICRPGTVRVDELMVLESYSHVHHIVSNVSGELRAGISPGSILRALFPGGTITGCPKVRCMEIIAELEQDGRGPYTGAIGYLDRSGDMDLNILIRSAWQQGERLGFRTGAGIVADSDPERELAETRAKAGGLLAVLGQTP